MLFEAGPSWWIGAFLYLLHREFQHALLQFGVPLLIRLLHTLLPVGADLFFELLGSGARSAPVDDGVMRDLPQPRAEPTLTAIQFKRGELAQKRNEDVLHNVMGVMLAQPLLPHIADEERFIQGDEFAPTGLVLRVLEPAEQRTGRFFHGVRHDS